MMPLVSTTLFPYTTLFRSQPSGGRPRRRGWPFEAPILTTRPQSWSKTARRIGSARTRRAGALAVWHRGRGGEDGRLDRKSTRLNSSHVKISYAVFCLKKKI